MNKIRSESGFSLVELLVVLAVSITMTTVSLYYLYSHQVLYKPDEQASLIIDMLQEARQRALTQKTTMRVEFDLTTNQARLIDERDTAATADDRVLRIFDLKAIQEVVIDRRPNNITINPVEPSPVSLITFVPLSTYPISLNNRVATLRFRKDSSVTDAGGTITGATIYVWQPDKANADNSSITRAITVIGASGAVRLWNHYPNLPPSQSWKDSRRFQ